MGKEKMRKLNSLRTLRSLEVSVFFYTEVGYSTPLPFERKSLARQTLGLQHRL